MKLFEIAITHKDKDGNYSIIAIPNSQVLVKDELAARIEAARAIPERFSSSEVKILVRPFV